MDQRIANSECSSVAGLQIATRYSRFAIRSHGGTAMPTTNLKKQFAGKVAVVTGGTQGLGEAIARLFAERGAAGLVIVGRNARRGKEVAAELHRRPASRPTTSRPISARSRTCRKVIAEADKAFGRVDMLVNVAALTDRGTILDTSPELFDRMFAVNVRAPFFLMQDAAKIMRREKIAGTVVNILSMSAHGGQPFITAYCGLEGRAASRSPRTSPSRLMPDHIRVNGLNIGWMDTPGEHAIQMRYHTTEDGLARRGRDRSSPSAACSSRPRWRARSPTSPATNPA